MNEINKVKADFDNGYIGYYLQVNEIYNSGNGNLHINRITNFTEIEKFKLEVYFHSTNLSYEIKENRILISHI